MKNRDKLDKKREANLPFVLWFTGLSGAGKSTLAQALKNRLEEECFKFEVLDGDVLQKVFPLTGFSEFERDSQNRKVGFIAGLLVKNGIAVICSCISPYKKSRQYVRNNVMNFIEVYVSTSLEVCEQRDPKGLYKKVRNGEIKQFTGIDDPYEVPENSEIVIDTDQKNVETCVDEIFDYLLEKEHLVSPERSKSL